MPTLDVSDVLLSPEFMDYVTVIRRNQVVNGFGEVSFTPQVFNNVSAVITTVGPNELERPDDKEYQYRSFTIISNFRLQGVAPNQLPDQVVYMGDTYIIDHVEVYSRYGAGLIEACMSSQDYVDQAPQQEVIGQADVMSTDGATGVLDPVDANGNDVQQVFQ